MTTKKSSSFFDCDIKDDGKDCNDDSDDNSSKNSNHDSNHGARKTHRSAICEENDGNKQRV